MEVLMQDIELNLPTDVSWPANFRLTGTQDLDTNLKVFSPTDGLAQLEGRFPKISELFIKVGIHPTKSETPNNPYTNQPAGESFTNIGEHCIAVAYASSRIMDALARAGVVNPHDADSVIERALVHDITKPYEIMRRDAKRDGLAEEVYTTSAYQQLAPLLQSTGVSADLAEYLINAGSETGHNSLKDLIEVDETGVKGVVAGRVAEKIVHLADDMTFTSNPGNSGANPVTLFLAPWERMLASGFIEKYSFLWKEGLGRTKSGDITTVRDINDPESGVEVIGDYAGLQVSVARAICREFQLLLAPENRQEPDAFIKGLINS